MSSYYAKGIHHFFENPNEPGYKEFQYERTTTKYHPLFDMDTETTKIASVWVRNINELIEICNYWSTIIPEMYYYEPIGEVKEQTYNVKLELSKEQATILYSVLAGSTQASVKESFDNYVYSKGWILPKTVEKTNIASLKLFREIKSQLKSQNLG